MLAKPDSSLLYRALGLLLMTMPAMGQKTDVHPSPDGSLRTIVLTLLTGESRVEIRAVPERVLFVRNQTSDDGAHGQKVVHAAWTSDSQFFVASTESVSGHQPWARPVWVYSRAVNQVLELGKLGAMATADFKLKAPDVFEAPVLDCGAHREGHSRLWTVKLSELFAAKREIVAPCGAR